MENKNRRIIGFILLIVVLVPIILIGILSNIRTLLLTIGIFSLLFYLNIALTTLGNAFIGRNINPNYDIFWKILFIIISSCCLSLFFTI